MILVYTAITGIVTSFVGSFACFVIWVHFDFDSRWEDRKERHRLRDLQRGRDLENEMRLARGLPPV